jgi:hypothetical protein
VGFSGGRGSGSRECKWTQLDQLTPELQGQKVCQGLCSRSGKQGGQGLGVGCKLGGGGGRGRSQGVSSRESKWIGQHMTSKPSMDRGCIGPQHECTAECRQQQGANCAPRATETTYCRTLCVHVA